MEGLCHAVQNIAGSPVRSDMKILLINHYAGSPEMGMEFRPYHFGKEWVEMGHEVTIVGASFSHLRSKQPKVEKRDVTEEWIDGIRYLWIKTDSYKGNGIGRIKNMMTFLRKLRKYRHLFVEVIEPDVVIASSTYPLDIYPARKIASMAKAKLIFEVHDLWPLSPMEISGYPKWHPFIMVMQKGEDAACKYSDAVVSLLPRADLHLAERGMDVGKFHWVSNGVVAEDWENSEPIPGKMKIKINALREKGEFLIGYAGGHADSNYLDFFLDALASVKEENITGVLVGDGIRKEELMNRATREGISNVVFLDPIPKMQVPDFLSHMDCLYNGIKHTKLSQYGTCFNKVYDYMMAGKPIINVATAPNDTVGDAQCGYTIEGEDPEKLRETILRIAAMTSDEKRKMRENGKKCVLKKYEYTTQIGRASCRERV